MRLGRVGWEYHQGVTGGSKETPLSAVRPCGMGVPPSGALDMSGSPHLTIGYLLKIGCGDFVAHLSLRSARNTMGTRGTPE